MKTLPQNRIKEIALWQDRNAESLYLCGLTAFALSNGASFYQVMPTYHNPTGKKAYIMNMYTAPEYRRQGIAINTLDLLVKDAKEQGVLQIALEATYMGRPLYER